ncbi:MAG: SGNH/GDSL hydrolase family protein [Planctomycetota bacterium]
MAVHGPTLKWLARIVFAVLASVILLEVGLRISSLFPGNTPFYVSDPSVGFRVRPNVIVGEERTNSSGFNDIERKKDKKTKDAIRIVVIGDSFVFGAVRRDSNFVFLTQNFARRSIPQVEIWNMGIPGTGPENYLNLIRQDVVSAEADLACVVFFIGNDITQSHPDFKIRIWFGAPREILRLPYLIRPSLEYFYGYRLLRAGGRFVKHYLAKWSGNGNGTFARDTYLSIEYQRSAIYKVKQDRRITESYSGAKAILKQMALEAADNNMGFLVVLAPDELQVNPQLREELIRRYSLDPGEYDFGKPQKVLMEYLGAAAIEAVNLLPDFVEARKTKTLYLKNDSHWNEEGNTLAAREISSYLVATLSGELAWRGRPGRRSGMLLRDFHRSSKSDGRSKRPGKSAHGS